MSKPTPTPSPASPRAAAESAARDLAAEAHVPDLALAAASTGDESLSLDTLLAHQLAAGHRLTMRLAAKADGCLDQAAPPTEADTSDGVSTRSAAEAVRFSYGAARMMERFRLGALALHKMRAPGSGGGVKTVRLVWGGPPLGAGGHRIEPDAAPAPAPTSPPANRGRLRNGNRSGDFAKAPRCGARTRSGGACRQPAMPNGRCRLHGGLSTGPRTTEGRLRCQRPHLRHGFRSAEILGLRRESALCHRRLGLLLAQFPAWHGVRRSDSKIAAVGRPLRGHASLATSSASPSHASH